MSYYIGKNVADSKLLFQEKWSANRIKQVLQASSM